MYMSIGELSRHAGIGIETIRFYERRGLVPDPPRAASGYRRYPLDTPQRLQFIKRGKRLGFTLDEIRILLTLQDGGGRHEVKAVAVSKLAEIETRLADLQRMRDTLHQLTERCSGKGNVSGCPIIEALAGDRDHNQGSNSTVMRMKKHDR